MLMFVNENFLLFEIENCSELGIVNGFKTKLNVDACLQKLFID